MVKSNDTTLIPKCRPEASIGVTDAAYTASITLDSGGGEARFLAGDTGVAAAAGDEMEGDYYRFDGQATGVRLIERSAAELATIRDEYADRNSQKDIYLTMHVQGSGSIPAGHYIYSTNPVFLALSPAFLSIVGGFTLLPTMEQKIVYMVDDDCSASTAGAGMLAGNTSSALYQTKLAQVHKTLQSVLTPPGQLTMRGDLVRLAESTEPTALEFMRPFTRVLNRDVDVGLDGSVTIPDNVEDVELLYEGRTAAALKVIIFSSVVALLISGVVLIKTTQYFTKQLEKRYAEVEVSFKIGLRGQCHFLLPLLFSFSHLFS